MAPRGSIARGNGHRKPIQRAVAYVRVSKEEQAEADRFSLPAQRREIAAYCQAKGWELVHTYADEGASARYDTLAKRPALQQLLDDTANGIADVVIVHDVSRWARNRAVFFNTLADLAERRIAFASVREDIDYSTPEGQMFLSILATFAAYFSDALAAHTSKGKHERARQGYYNGDLPYGYANPTPGRAGEYNKTVPVIVDEEAIAVRLAFETYAAGTATDAQIAALLNQRGYRVRHKQTHDSRTGRPRNPERLWTKDTVCRLLKNPFYLGVVPYKDELHDGQHAALIDTDLYRRCQEVRREHQKAPVRHAGTSRVYVLGGLARCAHCGEPLRAQASGERSYYRCAAAYKGKTCDTPRKQCPAAEPEAHLGAYLAGLRLPEDWREQILDKVQESDTATIAAERRDFLQRKLKRLLDAYLDLQMDKAEYERAREPFTEELAKLHVPEPEGLEAAGAFLDRLADLWAVADTSERHQLCAELFAAVDVDLATGKVAAVTIRSDYHDFFAHQVVVVGGTDGIRTRDLDIDSVAC